jgi:predicted Rossmann-fold nucleotide-binding protein
MLLGNMVQRCVKGIYFQYPSLSQSDFFSFEDRALLHDLHQFAIPVYWVDKSTNRILKYIEREERDSGMFAPINDVQRYLQATYFGLYGSNLVAGNFEKELRNLLQGLQQMRGKVDHKQMRADVPLALVTGGGPGVMEVGNRVAMDLGILSCANIVSFGTAGVVNEQKQNPYVEAKMTYRLDNLVERQAEFHLDYPLFLQGGIGTDFEQTLEEVRRKTGAAPPTPIILFGSEEYWADKISSRFHRNRESGTIKGSEWLSNCFYCIQNAEQGLNVYSKFFQGTLPIGSNGPVFDRGFVVPTDLL